MDDIKDNLDDYPELKEKSKQYWMAHVDRALFNKKGYFGESDFSVNDTLDELDS